MVLAVVYTEIGVHLAIVGSHDEKRICMKELTVRFES